MPDITVSAADLCRAVRAVTPHADSRPEDDFQAYCRVRFTIAGDNLHVYATQRVTAALALVSILDHGTGEAGEFDLTPSEAKELVRLFKPGRNAVEGEDGLTLKFDEAEVTITDVGGLVPGKSVTWPTSLYDSYPDVEALIGAQVFLRAMHDPPATWWTSGPHVALFAPAAQVYGAALRFARTSPRSLLVACGDAFVGLLSTSSAPVTDSDLDDYDNDAWRRRLPSQPRRPDDRPTDDRTDDRPAFSIRLEGALGADPAAAAPTD